MKINTTRHLAFILGLKEQKLLELATKYKDYYHPFTKSNSNKKRQIEPTFGKLRVVQSRIKTRILDKCELPEGILGGEKGKSIKENANKHLNKSYVCTIDLKNYFPSTNYKTVFSIFREHCECSTEVAGLLTRLTTYNRHVPQGISTSSKLVNLAILPLYKQLKSYCSRYQIELSAWGDDLTFSGEDVKSRIPSLIAIITKHGYKIRRKKVKVMPSNTRQEVTGITVNKVLSIPKDRLNKYKEILIESASNPDLVNKAKGQLSYVKFINKSQASKLEKIKKFSLYKADKYQKPPLHKDVLS